MTLLHWSFEVQNKDNLMEKLLEEYEFKRGVENGFVVS